MTIAVAIFAHQEERRIERSLASLPLDRPDTEFHILVNGSTDATADRARRAAGNRDNVTVHEFAIGGKSRTWNHFVHSILTEGKDAIIFMDGDAELTPGSIDALVSDLAACPSANAAAGMPMNGRMAAIYQDGMKAEGGMFGDLYALSGHFVEAIRSRRFHLPNDLIGDDGLIAAWAHTDLQSDRNWKDDRLIACDGAGFLCEQVSLLKPSTVHMQYKRLINYSVRYFQNRIVSDIMKREGPAGLPPLLSSLYAEWLPRFKPRSGLTGWFDRKALERMRRSA